ncbi:hypothetical protein [Pedobacter steynii]|uniref:Uncharacterized protein n=1 Tax=Pedobacter steynii TaxID=430522 RepID=A0A1D7QMQ8_9SPHI|nr:hypothetical protein [Pedobacter steynii]AOM79943.1 hypothetical protein BFS30_23930 [Pedobacter steynii]
MVFNFRFICHFGNSDTWGDIIEKTQFQILLFSALSAILYIMLAYLICRITDLNTALIINCFLALFDSTIGFLLSIRFKSNSGYTKEQSIKMIGPKTSIGVIVFALIFTLVGYGITLF